MSAWAYETWKLHIRGRLTSRGNAPVLDAGVESDPKEGVPPIEILNSAFIPGLDEVSRHFKASEFYVRRPVATQMFALGHADVTMSLLTRYGLRDTSGATVGPRLCI